MTEEQRKSFDFAQETTKQLLTLATGVLAVTITFRKDIVPATAAHHQGSLEWAWIAYLVSAVCGVLALGALASELARSSGTPDIYAKAVVIPAVLQSLVFMVAIVLTVVFGANALPT